MGQVGNMGLLIPPRAQGITFCRVPVKGAEPEPSEEARADRPRAAFERTAVRGSSRRQDREKKAGEELIWETKGA